MVRHRKPPSQTWRTFLRKHTKDLVSLDFFVVPTITFQLLFTFVILSHDRRRLVHFAVTANPTAEWTARQLLQAFPWDHAPRYLLRDRDRAYGLEFSEMAKWMGIHEVLTAPRSPWQNAHLERLIGSIRRECLDHVIVLNEAGLRCVLNSYFAYCEQSRSIYRWARTRQSVVRFNRQQWVGSWRFLKLAVCITSTRAKLRHLTLDATGMVYGSLRLIVGQLSFW